MFTQSYALDHSHPRKNGTLALKVKIMRLHEERVYIGLKMYLLPEQWDEKRERVVNSVTATTDNMRLNNYRVAIGKIILQIDESGETPSMAEVRRAVEVAIGQKQAKPTMFYAYYEEYIKTVSSPSTRQGFFFALEKIRMYDPVDRSFQNITAGWLRGFEAFCKNDGLAVNSIFTYLRNIRTVYNRAIDDGIASLNDYPFRRFKIKQEKTLEEKSDALIKKYINENVDDISTYEAISTSPLDSLFTHYVLQPEVYAWLEASDAEEKETDTLKALAEAIKPFAYFDRKSAIEMREYGQKIKQHAENMRAYLDSIEMFEQRFVPSFIGLTKIHKYRSKDGDGNITIKETQFVFNDDCSEIATYSPGMDSL